MSETHLDEYDHYNFETDKIMTSNGRQRTKKEVEQHTNHQDPSGHTRKIVTKLQNTEQNKKKQNVPKTSS